MKKEVFKYLNLVFGLFLVAFSFNLFFAKNNIVMGDITGLSIIASKIYSIDTFLFILTANIILLVLLYMVFNETLLKRAMLSSILLPVFIILTSFLVPLIKLQDLEMLLIVVIGAMLIGFGYGLVLKEGFSIGGVDIVGTIISKYFKVSNVFANLIVNVLIVFTSIFYFGFESMLYGFLALAIIHQLSSKMLLGINLNKTFYIMSSKAREIKEYFLEVEKQDVTIFNAKGGLKKKNIDFIMCVINSNDYYRIKTALETIDPKIFITITDSYESANKNLSIQGLKKEKKNGTKQKSRT